VVKFDHKIDIWRILSRIQVKMCESPLQLIEQYYHMNIDLENYKILAIRRDDKYACALAYKEVKSGHAHIGAMITHPDYRNTGIATRLINGLKTKYDKLSCNVLFSEAYNIKFWKKRNFEGYFCELDMDFVTMEYNKNK
jgi:GNAT superfamily N-acetyltransferase